MSLLKFIALSGLVSLTKAYALGQTTINKKVIFPEDMIMKLLFAKSTLFALFLVCTLLQRNYRFFYIFVFSATLLCLYIQAFCWVYIKKIMGSEEVSIWKAMTKTPASVALIIYTFIWVWFVGGLTVFHTYLISTNQV